MNWIVHSYGCLEPSRTAIIEIFAKIINGFKLVTSFSKKTSVVDVQLGSKYGSELSMLE